MNIDVLRPAELTSTQVQGWRQILLSSDELSSPFLSPEFTQAVARHRDDVYVALVNQGGDLAGVFPFQRDKRHRGWPVGGRLNDFQAGIFNPVYSVDTRQLLSACDLKVWYFDHLITSQPYFRGDQICFSESPCVDLSKGFDSYLSHFGSSSRIKALKRKERKLSREIGPLRFEFHTAEQHVFDTLVSLKTEHLRQKRLRNLLKLDWVVPFLEDIRRLQAPGFRGALSALYAGEELLAMHLGICNDQVIHWWITTFDPKFERYSVGVILLLQLIAHSSERGFTRLDLGKGDESYKRSFQTGAIQMAEGVIARNQWNSALQHTVYNLRGRLRATPLRRVARAVKKLAYTE